MLQVLLEKSLKPEDSDTFKYYDDIMKWADAERTLRVRTNADQPDQAANAIAFGAQGIGLCRTEHMFFGGERITAMREMILADYDRRAREAALAKLLPMQRDDFAGIFRAMGERPVTIRTLDPPLHEFLPHDDEDAGGDWRPTIGVPVERIGRQGRRAARVQPDARPPRLPARHRLSRDHAHAGAGDPRGRLHRQEGGRRRPSRDHDPAGRHQEGARAPGDARARAWPPRSSPSRASRSTYLVGTMIEIPRAALTADEIAEVAEFFSFGTNDLTQMTFGVSPRRRRQVPAATTCEAEIWPADPFETLDQDGVGQLVEMGIERGRTTRPDLKVGICGEHGGDPASGQVLPPRRAWTT